ncbi:MAG: alpha/beta hydrolase [Ktedonobacteraceae bacterium]|nr:alpha/beta hydrolase [Chloroflexota bacterium]
MATEDNVETTMTGGVTHRFIETNGIRMHLAEQGQGPLVLLCHGFPESWYSWRFQLSALAEAGYHVVAPDQRGYGQTDRPDPIEAYTIFHLVGDMVGLLDALGEEQAIIVGHDWGANVAWNAALMRPDRFPTVIVLSIPYAPRGPAHGPHATIRPTEAMKRMAGDRFFYQLYFQQPGVAEAELERNVRTTMRRLLYAASGDALPSESWKPILPDTDTAMLTSMVDPQTLPGWLTEADIDFYTAQFQHTGFRGGLNWYRNFDRNWELLAPYSGAKITQPTLFIWGERDPIFQVPGSSQRLERMANFIPNLRTVALAGCGHWAQQERVTEVNEAILAFLQDL